MSEENINILNNKLQQLTVNLNAINYNLSRYTNLSSYIIRSESINKIRRYGEKEYINRFSSNPNRNVSAFMRPFLYTQAMEKKLIEKRNEIFTEINKIKFEISILENDTNE